MRTEFERGQPVLYTAPNGVAFKAVVETGRVDRYGTVVIRHKSDERLVWALPERLQISL